MRALSLIQVQGFSQKNVYSAVEYEMGAAARFILATDAVFKGVGNKRGIRSGWDWALNTETANECVATKKKKDGWRSTEML